MVGQNNRQWLKKRIWIVFSSNEIRWLNIAVEMFALPELKKANRMRPVALNKHSHLLHFFASGIQETAVAGNKLPVIIKRQCIELTDKLDRQKFLGLF